MAFSISQQFLGKTPKCVEFMTPKVQQANTASPSLHEHRFNVGIQLACTSLSATIIKLERKRKKIVAC
ncbi:hypothetical protein SLA2020_194440 [Shorea laevis]